MRPFCMSLPQPSLVNRVDLLKEAAGVFARHKATPFFQKATEEQAELLEVGWTTSTTRCLPGMWRCS